MLLQPSMIPGDFSKQKLDARSLLHTNPNSTSITAASCVDWFDQQLMLGVAQNVDNGKRITQNKKQLAAQWQMWRAAEILAIVALFVQADFNFHNSIKKTLWEGKKKTINAQWDHRPPTYGQMEIESARSQSRAKIVLSFCCLLKLVLPQKFECAWHTSTEKEQWSIHFRKPDCALVLGQPVRSVGV
jgi:hypothetical protein